MRLKNTQMNTILKIVFIRFKYIYVLNGLANNNANATTKP